MEIKLLNNNEIDIDRWDIVVKASPNARVYAESWYLDIVNPDWLGLIWGNYDYVMPVSLDSKLGIRYIFQPVYAQQQGIFPTATPEITSQFISKLKELVRFFEISMNSLSVKVNDKLEISEGVNYILPLKNSYDRIFAGYSSHAKRYSRKAKRENDVLAGVPAHEFLSFKEQLSGKEYTSKHRVALRKIVTKSVASQRGIVYGAYAGPNELCAAAFFLFEQKRFIYHNSVSSPSGKEKRAMFAIVDRFIRDYANTPFLLDFEGSNIDGIARFFSGFGAQPEHYQQLKYNNLPYFLRLIKK
ncbi:MAG: hypothetical protein PF486_12255 [Prolixibacteraceae bacterium]|jgi:hypothetical protein|nr:hypothetical protein [Prolixibacteraceae bacterium]